MKSDNVDGYEQSQARHQSRSADLKSRASVTTGFPLFFRLARRTIFQSRGTHARPTLRRAAMMAAFIPFLFSLQTLHRIAFLLDDLLFPAHRDIAVREPVFIIGIPRSGTTFLHRVMARDTEEFTTIALWEMLLAPSIIERKLWLFIGKIDRALGGFGKRIVVRIEDRILEDVRKIHRVSLFEPEEDDLILFPIFASIFLLFPFPFADELWHHVRFDDQTPPEDRRRIMKFYRQCVQRHLYVHGAEKRFLSKNPAFSPRIDSLNAEFPDCKFICNVRDPHEAVPSLLSFLTYNWNRFDNDPRDSQFRDMVLELAAAWYRHPIDRLPNHPENRQCVVTYDDLTAAPRQTIEALYHRLDIPMTPTFATTLHEREEKAKTYKSRHQYALSDFNLTEADIHHHFSDIIQHYAFTQQPTEQAAVRIL